MTGSKYTFRVLSGMLTVFFVIYIIIHFKFMNKIHPREHLKSIDKIENKHLYVVITTVVCGNRLEETLTMLKSAILFSFGSPLKLIIVSEETLIQNINYKLTKWQSITNASFVFETKKLSFPESNGNEWKTLFKPCAAQRLFLPTILPDVDSVLYVDTDTLFMAPPQLVWELYKNFNSSHMSALSPEHEDPNVGWYNRFAKHPYYGTLGVNSGVMLMNLTRMRKFMWTDYVLPIYKKYKMQITWGDQDIINILFHYHPEKLYVFSCLYNYRPDHCMYMSVCNLEDKNKPLEGIVVLHGNRGYFHSLKQPIFYATYQAMFGYKIGSDPFQNFLSVMENVESNITTNCEQVKDLLLAYSRKYITKRSSH